jgi:hypothetical protein
MRSKGLAFAIVAVLVAAMPVFAQSLGDLAKKEEERRKKIHDPAKVYTNKDLGSAPAPSTPPAAPDAAAATPAAPADAAAKDKEAAPKEKDPARDQAYWAAKGKSLHEAVSRNETYAEALQSRVNALTTDFVNRDDPAQRSVIERNRLKALGELDRLKKEIVAGKKAITDFEEEARRAGVPPGWLR